MSAAPLNNVMVPLDCNSTCSGRRVLDTCIAYTVHHATQSYPTEIFRFCWLQWIF